MDYETIIALIGIVLCATALSSLVLYLIIDSKANEKMEAYRNRCNEQYRNGMVKLQQEYKNKTVELEEKYKKDLAERENKEYDMLFGLSNTAKVFWKYYKELCGQKIVAKSKYSKPLSAALLFSMIDFGNMQSGSPAQRQRCAEELFSLLEKDLNDKELEIFDYSIEQMGEVIRGGLIPRGDWDVSGASSNDIDDLGFAFRLFVFFGDCIIFENLLFNYQNEPIQIVPPYVALFNNMEMYTSIIEVIKSFINSMSLLNQ